jgi:NADPH-dependent curcumin reductase CurA
MRTSRQVHLVSRPEGLPTEENFALVEVDVAEPGPGEVLVQNLFMSVDPAMRPRLSAGYELNAPMGGSAIGRVIASRAEELSEGDVVANALGFRELFTAPASGLHRIEPVPGHPITVHMHVLGGTGLTGYGGILKVGAIQEGERVFVSTAAGAVGSVAAQVAKLRGCSVVGSTGSDEKARWLLEAAGLDRSFNYRDQPVRRSLRDAAPDGIDVYFDNVGGDHLDAALACLRPLGRVAVCGMISGYNEPGARTTVHNLSNIIYGRITIRGFTVADFPELRNQFREEMTQWLAEGKIKYQETVLDGIESAPRALIGLFQGLNAGKMLVKLSD